MRIFLLIIQIIIFIQYLIEAYHIDEQLDNLQEAKSKEIIDFILWDINNMRERNIKRLITIIVLAVIIILLAIL